jgi:hypothetical protein
MIDALTERRIDCQAVAWFKENDAGLFDRLLSMKDKRRAFWGPSEAPDVDPEECRSRFRFKPNETKQLLAERARVFTHQLVRYDVDELDRLEEPLVRASDDSDSVWRNCTGFRLAAYFHEGDRIGLEHFIMARFRLRATRTLLAALAYERTHGRLPLKLDDLVPDFLNEVPADPFDENPIRYSRERRILYSVGTDQVDNGGEEYVEIDEDSEQRDRIIKIP